MIFALLLRSGFTGPFSSSLREAGRLDIAHQAALNTFFLAGSIRRNNELHLFLYGPPNPPLHLSMIGKEIYDIRTDEETWREILLEVLSGKHHQGIYLSKEGIEPWINNIIKQRRVFVMHERGKNIIEIKPEDNDCFVIGDHIGLPKNLEKYILRLGGQKLSIGKKHYLAAQVIEIINYIYDVYGGA